MNSIPRSIHKDMWDQVTDFESILRNVPHFLRREVAFMSEFKPSGVAHVITNSDNVYELRFTSDRNYGIGKNTYEYCNKIQYDFIPQLSQKNIVAVIDSYYYTYAHTEKSVLSYLTHHPCQLQRDAAAEVRFAVKVLQIRATGASAVLVLLSNHKVMCVTGEKSVEIDTKGLAIRSLIGGCFVSGALAETGEIIIWSMFTIPQTKMLHIPENFIVKSVAVKDGAIHALSTDGRIVQWDVVLLMLMAMYSDVKSHQKSDICQVIKNSLSPIMSHFPQDVLAKIDKTCTLFSERGHFPDFPPGRLLQLDFRVVDMLVTSGTVYLLDLTGRIRKFSIKRNEQDEIMAECAPELIENVTWDDIQMFVNKKMPVPIKIIPKDGVMGPNELLGN